MKTIIRCPFGIGNRVATLANALSRHGEIAFHWKVNAVLPLDHSDVFPNGLDGVEFIHDCPLAFATRWTRKIPGESWEGAGEREFANAAYARIMESMAGSAWAAPEVAIMARFQRFPDAECGPLADLAAMHGKSAFILSDSRRGTLAEMLATHRIAAVIPQSREMESELDRTPENTMAYLSDWKTACGAKIIITHPQETSVTYPARAAGAKIINSPN